MPFIKQGDNRKLAVAIGFWSALLVAVLNIWFYIAYGLYQSIQLSPWRGLTDYVSSYQPLPLLAWVIPCFLLAPIFLIMISCLHIWTGAEKIMWSFLAVVFAVIYTTLMSVNYYIQMTVVQYNLSNGKPDGLSLWLYAYPYPRSFPGAFEGVAYGFMCVSFLFAAQIFTKEKLRRWVHWMFVGTGITGLVVFIDPLFRLPIAFLMVDGIAGSIFLTLAPILLAVMFRRDIYQFRKVVSQTEIELDQSSFGRG
ncbi:hypothetical protein JR338_05660 [Chloroflexota bacterium]|nr:hypothetical protein JR338_05660 [Chloroflexota bacterium]